MQRLILVKTLQQLKALEAYIADKDVLAYDVETTGTDKESIITDFAICAEVGKVDVAYCVQIAYWDVKEQKLLYYETHKGAKAFLEKLKGKRLIMQSGPFDCAMTMNNYGVELIQDLEIDTLAIGHLLNENRLNGLKERGVELFGENARAEQAEMKASVIKNGGVLTKDLYELCKADSDLRANYCAKDTILTMNVACHDLPILYAEKLDQFYFEETMPLMRGPTYQMNTTGLRVDPEKLSKLKGELEVQILTLEAEIYADIEVYTRKKYPKGFGKKAKEFNISSREQLAWLLFEELGEYFHMLTKTGQKMLKVLEMKRPYTNEAKREFIEMCDGRQGQTWEAWEWNSKKKFMEKKIRKIPKPVKYMSVGKETCEIFSKRYRWVAKLMEHAKARKLLKTYVEGIQKRMKYSIIRPSFLQCGTTSGRYSSKNPNFQNLPRGDKRVKSCIVARQGKVFVGADYAQLEPRVFTSVSQDPSLLACFVEGLDFYSVVGAPIFDKEGKSTTLKKGQPGSFDTLFPEGRQMAKSVALGLPYGQTEWKMSATLGRPIEECRQIAHDYFTGFPGVKSMMLKAYDEAMTNGVVYNLFGRPRRMPKAKKIRELFGDAEHSELPYEWRTILNLAVNHKIQSTAASLMNRAAIAFYEACQLRSWSLSDARWLEVRIVMQVHDELIVECPEALAEEVAALLKYCMENTSTLPGVALIAEPKIGLDLAELK